MSEIMLPLHINKVTTYDDILYEAWEDFENSNKKILKTMMTNLRKKLPDKLIDNIYGIGYKIVIKK